ANIRTATEARWPWVAIRMQRAAFPCRHHLHMERSTSLPLRQFILLDLRCDSVLFLRSLPPVESSVLWAHYKALSTQPAYRGPPRGRPSYRWHQIPVDARSPVNAVQAALQLAFRAVPSLVPVALSPKGNSHRDNGQLTRQWLGLLGALSEQQWCHHAALSSSPKQPSLEPLKKDWALTGLLVLKVLGARWGPFRPVSFGVGGRHRCIVPFGVAVAAARMGSIVLRLCRTSTPFANPPEGFGDKKPTLFVFLLPCPPREQRHLEMFFKPEIEERVSGGNCVHDVFTKWRTGRLLQYLCKVFCPSLYLSLSFSG
ncbi:hypothetical protein JOQ06_025799, partial [Pogonophryne albipinna]